MSAAVLTAALTCPIATKADNPALPTTTEEIAAAATDGYAQGAAIVHVHLRDADGRPTTDLEIARRTVALIGESCPALVQVSTGVGFNVTFEEREHLIEARPEMATLNVCSLMLRRGVAAAGNGEPMRRLAAVARAIEREPATVEETRALLRLEGGAAGGQGSR